MSCGWCGHGHCPHCGYGHCGHGHCHHWGYEYGPPGPWMGYGPGYAPRRRRRRAADEEDLAAYLEDLEEEAGQVREELERLRRSRRTEQG